MTRLKTTITLRLHPSDAAILAELSEARHGYKAGGFAESTAHALLRAALHNDAAAIAQMHAEAEAQR